MKKWTVSIALVFCSLLTAQAVELEKWTYDGISYQGLNTVLSETGTDSAFGPTDQTSPYYLYVDGIGTAGIYGLLASADLSQGISAPSYAGKSTGGYEISFDVPVVSALATGKGNFGWGLRSTTNGISEGSVLVQFDGGNLQLLVTDKDGPRPAQTIGTVPTTENLNVRMFFNLDTSGTPGSLRVFYTLGTAPEQELFTANQLTLQSNFTISDFHMFVGITSGDFSWGNSDFLSFDNLLFKTVGTGPELSLIGKQISFVLPNGDQGIISGDTYEPGDTLQIITTNQNVSLNFEANNVTTTLAADSSAFKITPLTNTFASVGPKATYTATFEVEVLDAVPDGSNTFTVVNQIAE